MKRYALNVKTGKIEEHENGCYVRNDEGVFCVEKTGTCCDNFYPATEENFRLVIPVSEFMARYRPDNPGDEKTLEAIVKEFGDQLLGIARGVGFSGYKEENVAKFMMFGDNPIQYISKLKAIIGKRKFWLRRWAVKHGLYAKRNINIYKCKYMNPALPEIYDDYYLIPEGVEVNKNYIFEEGAFTVFRIFFAE